MYNSVLKVESVERAALRQVLETYEIEVLLLLSLKASKTHQGICTGGR